MDTKSKGNLIFVVKDTEILINFPDDQIETLKKKLLGSDFEEKDGVRKFKFQSAGKLLNK